MKLESNETYTIITREHIIDGLTEQIHEELHVFDYNTLIDVMLDYEDDSDKTIIIENNIIRIEYCPEYYMEYLIFNNKGATRVIYDEWIDEFVPMSEQALAIFNSTNRKEVK